MSCLTVYKQDLIICKKKWCAIDFKVDFAVLNYVFICNLICSSSRVMQYNFSLGFIQNAFTLYV